LLAWNLGFYYPISWVDSLFELHASVESSFVGLIFIFLLISDDHPLSAIILHCVHSFTYCDLNSKSKN